MIKLFRDDISTTVNTNYLNLYDEMTNSDYKVLITVTNQLTGNSKTFISPTTYTNKNRYVILSISVTASSLGENLSNGVIFLGSTDYPLGFYDVTIYQNTSNANLDPSGLTVIYNGLANLAPTSDVNSVVYSEYTTNDADTDSVYITLD
tara:strand:- start:1429 stop:1875 length:447 start_codon:yes stop_codon:yes gene_type:complete